MEWQQTSLAHCQGTLCTCFLRVCELKYEYACQKERASNNFWCPATLSKLGSCQCRGEIYCCECRQRTFRILMSLLLLGAWFFFWHVSAILQLAVSWIQQEISLTEQHRATVVLYRDTLALFFFFPLLHFLFFTSMFWCLWGLSFAVWS